MGSLKGTDVKYNDAKLDHGPLEEANLQHVLSHANGTKNMQGPSCTKRCSCKRLKRKIKHGFHKGYRWILLQLTQVFP